MTQRQATAIILCAALLGAFAATAASSSLIPGAHAQGPPAHVYQGSPWLGFIADKSFKDGVRVSTVVRGGPAQDAKLSPGDVLVSVDGAPIKSVRSLKLAVRPHSPGDTLALVIERDGEQHDASLELGRVPNNSELLRMQWLGQRAPKLEVKPVNAAARKRSWSKGELREKITVIDFWATWCRPCERVKPVLEDLQDKHKDKIDVIAISAESRPTIAEHLERKPMSYPVVRDLDERTLDAFIVREYPTVLIVDSKGVVRKIITSHQNPKLIEEAVDSLVELEAKKKSE